MGMLQPLDSKETEPMVDHIPEGTPFFLESIRVAPSFSKQHGPGEMVVIRARGFNKELGIWGAYLLRQAKAVERDDLNKWYKVIRAKVEGFGGDNPSKQFVLADPPSSGQTPSQATPAETIPF